MAETLRLHAGDSFLLDYGPKNINTRLYHVRAVVDGDQYVVRTWSKKWGGHWHYRIMSQQEIDAFADNIKVRATHDRDTPAKIARPPEASVPTQAAANGATLHVVLRRRRASGQRHCMGCGDTVNAGESVLTTESVYYGFQCGCAEKIEMATSQPAPPEQTREPENG